jgi:hypothetical protein
MTDCQPAISEPRFSFPTPERPFYHLQVTLDLSRCNTLKIIRARIDGVDVRDIWVYNDGKPSPDDSAHAGCRTEVVVRADWENDAKFQLELDLEDEQGQTSKAVCDATAPHWGGYWNRSWHHYSAYVVHEHHGLQRAQEPIHLLVADYTEHIQDPAQEVRVVAIDPSSGLPQEIPSQVYGIATQDGLSSEEAQPTTTFEVAFLADVPAHSARVYLVFYGNPQAPAPVYTSDLTVSGEGLDLTIENSYYRVVLHSKSGQLDEILLKQGVNVVFDHHIETNGALHWNPDIYAPPRIWSHASDWDPPANVTTISGPIFFMIQRWGELPDYPDVQCSVTYTFYAHQPYLIMQSVTDILEDLDVRALRNGELVLNLNVAREYAWKEPNGSVKTLRFVDHPKEPRRAIDIPADSPWWAFFNRDEHAALSGIILDSSAYQRGGGLARMEPYITLKWGPFAYCVRPLVYTYNSQNPQRVVRVPASSTYSERLAFLPIRLERSDAKRFAPIDAIQQRLAGPLSISSPEMKIDPRVPENWGVTFPYPD